MGIVRKQWAIIPFAFIQMVALSADYYSIPQFIVHKLCHNTFNQTVCRQLGNARFRKEENYIFEKAATWNAIVNFAGFFPAVFTILPLGAMSDLVPKKRMLLLPAIFGIVSCLIKLCSSVFITLHLGFVALASFVTCTFGEINGCVMLCCTYAANACPENRTLAIRMTIASVWLGFCIGSLILNYLTRYYGYSVAFLFATSSLIVGLLYAIVLIPPIDDDDNERSLEKNKNDFWEKFKEHAKGTWIHMILFMKKYFWRSKDNTILLLLIGAFLFLVSFAGERVLITLVLRSSPFNFKADQIGMYIAIFEFSRVFGFILLAFAAKKNSNLSDYTLMFMGAVSSIITYTIISFSRTTLMLYLSTIPAVCQSFFSPAVRSKLNNLVEANECGAVLSLIGMAQICSYLLMSPIANALFAATAKVYSGFSILLMSGSCLVCLLILCYVYFTTEWKVSAVDDYHKLPTKEDNNQER